MNGSTESGSSGDLDATTSAVGVTTLETTASGSAGHTTSGEATTQVDASTTSSTADATTVGASEHRVFLSSSIHRGDLGGVEGADAICRGLAGRVGLPDTFRAILSGDGAAAAERLTVAGRVRTLDGQLVAVDAEDLWDGSIGAPLIVDENGARGRSVGAWTGSDAGGAEVESNCDNWTNGSAQRRGTRGAREALNAEWITWGAASCNRAFHLYCLEQ